MQALARFSITRPLLVIALWVAAIVGVQGALAIAGDSYSNDFELTGTDSQAARDLLEARFPGFGSGAGDQLVWHSDGGQYDDPALRSAVEGLITEIAGLNSVALVVSPFSGQAPNQVSPDGTVAFATIQYGTGGFSVDRADLEAIADGVASLKAEGYDVAVGGQGIGTLSQPEVGPAEGIGVVIAAIILLFAFGSLAAMILPLVSALAALGVGLGAVGLLANGFSISDTAPIIGALLGLGVGIDYALFVVNRHRRNLIAGQPVQASIVTSINTSGRAVVFAGIAVVIALAGMFTPGISFLDGMAIGASVAVVFTVLSTITLLPALLKLMGLRVLNKRARAELAAGRTDGEHASRPFVWWAKTVQSHPLVIGGAALLTLVLLLIPALSLRLGAADQGNDPAGSTTREAYDLLSDGFGPGFNGPLIVAVDLASNPIDPASLDPANPTQIPPQLAPIATALSQDPGVAAMLGPIPNQAGDAALFQVIPTTSPQDAATSELVNRIRDDYAPASADAGAVVHVGGVVAVFEDFAHEIQSKLLLFFSVVILLGTALVIIAFRSLLVPLVGAVMNILSIGAAFGVLVAIFQWGWGSNLLRTGDGGPIESFLPIIMFALVFGLSMDYQVFLVSRIAEEWHARRNNTEAVRAGHAEVGRVILAAAGIMIFVFAGFALADARIMKLFGLGLAVAVAIDALIVRAALVPAIMHVVGKSNWWLPRWLDRVLPHVAIEDAEDERAAAEATGGAKPKVGVR